MPWSNAHKRILHAYRRYAGWDDDYYHERLEDHTGCRSSTDHRLDQEDFDAFMPVLESAAHLCHVNGRGHGRTPKRGMNWHYWRDRRPPDGQASTRQARKIWTLLRELGDIIGHPHDPVTYLRGILEQAHGGDWPPSSLVSDLLAWQAGLLIEALRDRTEHARRRKEGEDPT